MEGRLTDDLGDLEWLAAGNMVGHRVHLDLKLLP